MKKQFLLGLMAMLLPWTAWAEDQQGDFKITLGGGATYEYNSTGTNPQVTVTSLEGETLNPNWYDVIYTLTNGNGTDQEVAKDEIKDAGVYTVTVKAAGSMTGKLTTSTATFTITPKKLESVSVNSLTKKYGIDVVNFDVNSLKTADGELTGGELENAKNCLTFEVVGNKTFEQAQNANAGETFEVKISGKDNDPKTTTSNYYFAPGNSGNVTASLVIIKRDLAVVLKNSEKDYTGGNLSLNTMNANANNRYFTIEGDGVKAGDNVTVTLTGANGETGFKNVGTYTINVSIDETSQKNYNLTTETLTYTINQVEMTIKKKSDAGDLKITFGEPMDVTKSFDLGFASDEKGQDYYTVVATLAEDSEEGVAGTYQALIYFRDQQVSKMSEADQAKLNYTFKYDPTIETVEVEAKEITGADITITDLAYQGAKFNATKTIKNEAGKEEHIIEVTLGETPLVYGVDYKLEDDAVAAVGEGGTATDATEQFTVTITGIGNYKGTETSKEQTIEKATLKITPKTDAEFSKVYDGIAVGELRDKFDMTFVGETDNYDNVKLANGTTGKLTMGTSVTNGFAVKAGVNKVIYVRVGTAQLNGSTVDETTLKNYNIDYTKSYYTIEKRTSTFSIATAQKDYTGTEETPDFTFTFTNPAGEGDAKETAAQIFDKDKAPTIVVDSEKAAVNAGSYALKLDDSDDKDVDTETEGVQLWVSSNYDLTYVEPTENLYTINKAAMAIQIQKAAQTIPFGSVTDDGKLTAEILKTWINGRGTYIRIGMDESILGFQDDADMARTMMTFELQNGAETGKSGTYTNGLKVYVEEEDENWTADQKLVRNNYEIIDGIADLTIGNVTTELVLNGAEDADAMQEANPEAETIPMILARLNGAKVEKVTIKNLKNVTPAHTTMYTDMWYSLVLPFDVTVREISKAFGYAIVDVPNESNTDSDVISFKLHMGTVPANTMMLFKVDEVQDWTEKSWTFEEAKTIVYDPEAVPVNDGYNYFIPVYQITELNEPNQWYMYYNGKSYNAAKNPNTMYPLNGYIKAAAGENARIYVEEADGTITAINAVTGEEIHNKAEGWYTIGGVKLEGKPTEKGVYINNGMKVVIK